MKIRLKNTVPFIVSAPGPNSKLMDFPPTQMQTATQFHSQNATNRITLVQPSKHQLPLPAVTNFSRQTFPASGPLMGLPLPMCRKIFIWQFLAMDKEPVTV